MMKRILVFCFFVVPVTVFAQLDFNKQYENAKTFFEEGKYGLAMESLKPLIPYDQNNPYSEYASFYYALAAYHQGYLAVAKDMLNQIRTVHPNWDKMDEVNFWIGKIHFDNGDYFQGLKVFESIKDKAIRKDIETVKAARLPSITDEETLRMMMEDYPRDSTVARSLANLLARNLGDDAARQELEDLIKRFEFNRSEFIPEAPSTVHKERYAVSLLMPFDLRTLTPAPGRKNNQVILDFYEGMKLALDSLNAEGIEISLRAYDTQRDAERIKALLDTEELKTTDLIVGPLFLDETAIVKEFSETYGINVIHPFSRSSDVIGTNPHSFLFQPTSETLGVKSAEFLAAHAADEKECFVFYGPGKQDSVLAFSFMKHAIEKGINIIHFERVEPRESRIINEILQTPTEFDDFKYPTEYTLRKDSIDCIFVASDDPVIYAKVVGSVEARGDSILVVGSENWLDDNAVDLETYQSLRVALAAPNFADPEKPGYKNFFRAFLRRYGRKPSKVAQMGYELLLFVGHQLKDNGVYFQQGLFEAGNLPGYLGAGFRYPYSRDNQLIPFIGIRDGELALIDQY